MPRQRWSAAESQRITTRIVVEGDLVLQTPAHFGNGDGDALTDMPLLIDPLDGRTPLLTGASIAGALRSYLREREHGHRQAATSASASVLPFGGAKGDEDGKQSALIVDDALGREFGVERRDGVRIRPDSRTAEQGALFDVELWRAGTTFPLRFELLIHEGDAAAALKRAVASALEGFIDGGITLGARKRRGYGRVHVENWRVKSFELTEPDGLLDWLVNGAAPLPVSADTDLNAALGITDLLTDVRTTFRIEASLALDGSLLIRSGGGHGDQGPDMVHLQAHQPDGRRDAVLSGTSLGGALRARARKIARALAPDAPDRAEGLVDALFGKTDRASRVSVRESVVRNARTDLVQNRVSIDRFTGGAREGALFNEQPAFSGDDTLVSVDVRLVNPEEHEIGLLLLLLKDLWTGDLPLGGERSVGRGRLKGKQATLSYQNGESAQAQTWALTAHGTAVTVTGGDRERLEEFAARFTTHMRGEAA